MKMKMNKKKVLTIIAGVAMVGSGFLLGMTFMNRRIGKEKDITAKEVIRNLKHLTGIDFSKPFLMPKNDDPIYDYLEPTLDKYAIENYGTTDAKFKISCFAQKRDD